MIRKFSYKYFKKLRDENNLISTELTEKMDDLDTLQTKLKNTNLSSKEITKINSSVKRYIEESRELTKNARNNLRKMENISDNLSILFSIVTLVIFVFSAFTIQKLLYLGPDKININFYIVTAQIIPVLLISIFVDQNSKNTTKKSYLANAISIIIPAFIGENVALIAIAINRSNVFSLVVTIGAFIQLFSQFIVSGYLSSVPSTIKD